MTDPTDIESYRKTIQSQLEYYFSHQNLPRDNFLKSQMNAYGQVRLSLIANFRRVRELVTDIDLIIEAAKLSDILEIETDPVNGKDILIGLKATKLAAMQPAGPAPRTTLIFRDVAAEVTEADIRAIFTASDVVSAHPDIANSWYVTLTDEKTCKSEFLRLQSGAVKLGGQPIHVRIKSESVPIKNYPRGAVAATAVPLETNVDYPVYMMPEIEWMYAMGGGAYQQQPYGGGGYYAPNTGYSGKWDRKRDEGYQGGRGRYRERGGDRSDRGEREYREREDREDRRPRGRGNRSHSARRGRGGEGGRGGGYASYPRGGNFTAVDDTVSTTSPRSSKPTSSLIPDVPVELAYPDIPQVPPGQFQRYTKEDFLNVFDAMRVMHNGKIPTCGAFFDAVMFYGEELPCVLPKPNCEVEGLPPMAESKTYQAILEYQNTNYPQLVNQHRDGGDRRHPGRYRRGDRRGDRGDRWARGASASRSRDPPNHPNVKPAGISFKLPTNPAKPSFAQIARKPAIAPPKPTQALHRRNEIVPEETEDDRESSQESVEDDNNNTQEDNAHTTTHDTNPADQIAAGGSLFDFGANSLAARLRKGPQKRGGDNAWGVTRGAAPASVHGAVGSACNEEDGAEEPEADGTVEPAPNATSGGETTLNFGEEDDSWATHVMGQVRTK